MLVIVQSYYFVNLEFLKFSANKFSEKQRAVNGKYKKIRKNICFFSA